jgi:hypothetical protein
MYATPAGLTYRVDEAEPVRSKGPTRTDPIT